ncbi:hypothetical protein B0J18DRAFT_406410 [Chaetomium sp. MPI-SDFR-AT-0129]|nr:hypothetical protein B0J18DRAFT_406410 [Chaetomium sp. MPI-SDFR-AT-0129]
MSHLPKDLQQPFPDASQFKTATHMRNIIELLEQHDIACCIVGIKALCYYGAGRLCETIEFCVPTQQLEAANSIFSNGPASQNYTPWRGFNPVAEARLRCSLYHTFPRYRLNSADDGPLFDFYLVPSNDWRFECVPENFEYSAQCRLPYPKLHLFAQSLLERQNMSDIQDLVDGMDLTEEWGDDHLFSNKTSSASKEGYARWVSNKNAQIRAALPDEVKNDPLTAILGTSLYELGDGPINFRENFNHLARTRQERIGPEYPPGTFVTKFRAKGSPDPRTEIRFEV